MLSTERRHRRRRARSATKRLESVYGSPRLGNKDDPLDELFFILISQMTTGPSYERVFDRLKERLPCWDGLTKLSVHDIASVISDAGLVNQKAPRLLAIGRQLRKDFGCVSLNSLRNMSDAECLDYLTGLPGVGVKTAKCVLMYSLDRSVLPVDTHTARIGIRLRLVDALPSDRLAKELEKNVAPKDRYAFHVNSVAHGRAVCRALRPRCDTCQIRSLCPSRSNFFKASAKSAR